MLFINQDIFHKYATKNAYGFGTVQCVKTTHKLEHAYERFFFEKRNIAKYVHSPHFSPMELGKQSKNLG